MHTNQPECIMSNLSNLFSDVSTALEKIIAQTKYINFESLNVRVAEGASLSLSQGGDLSQTPTTVQNTKITLQSLHVHFHMNILQNFSDAVTM